MDLITAKVEAAKQSKAAGKKRYIIVDDEGECTISAAPLKGAIAVYSNGSEIALSSDLQEGVSESEAKLKPSKRSAKAKSETVAAEASSEASEKSTNSKKEKVMTTTAKKSAKKTAKTAAKKTVPKKLAATKAAPSLLEIKADSLIAGVRDFIKQDGKKGVLTVKGKVWAINRSQSWAVRKTAVELGKDGIIMVIEGAGGFYAYPKSEFKEFFGSIFASNTWKNIGIYSQSTLPKSHGDFWTELKK